MSEKSVRARPVPWLLFLLFGLANLAFLLRFGDRDGYEGDDLNSVLPMAHLAAARHGALIIYRYAWQPLSYELGALSWTLFGTPTAAFLSSAVAGACAITLFLVWLWREGRPRPAALTNALLALLVIPELWYSSLYFNSTIRGLPLIALALLLVRGRSAVPGPVVAGVLTGLAILMRLDFLLICPLLAMASWRRGESIVRPILLAMAVVATLLAGFAAGLIDFAEIARINAFNSWEIAQNVGKPGWDRLYKTMVLAVELSPVGWLMLLGGAVLLLDDAWRRRDWRALAWIVATLPSLYPILNLLSPKYLLQSAPFALLLLVRALEALEDRLAPARRLWAKRALWAGAILPFFLSVSLYGHAPYMVFGLSPDRPVNTADGRRGWGGYLWQMIDTDAPDARNDKQRAAARLADELLAGPGENLVFLGGENAFDAGGMGWRDLQLILYQRGLHSQLVAPHMLHFDLGHGRWLVLARSLPRNLAGQHYRLIDMTTDHDRPIDWP